jgi:predicted phosphohydrolase
MKIQYCSDLHLEFPQNRNFLEDNPLIPTGDILLLAGDIIPFSKLDQVNKFFNLVSSQFEVVYWLPGNHEYYHFDIAKKPTTLNEKIKSNVFLVNNFTVEHKHVRFIFSTLWSKIGRAHQFEIESMLSDFHLIKNDSETFTPEDFNNLHNISKKFIQSTLSSSETDKTVVITHHVPTFINYPEQYIGSSLNDAFTVELADMIKDSGIDYWIYGHHHVNTPAFKIGKTELLTNQLGYVAYGEHELFNGSAVIEF